MSDFGKSMEMGFLAIGGALLLGGIGLGLGIAAGPGILGSIIVGAIGGAVGAGAGFVGGLVYADKSDDISKFFKNAKKTVKEKLGQAKGFFSKLRQNVAEQSAEFRAKAAPKTDATSKLDDKTVKADFEDKSKQTEQKVTETPAPAQKADVKKTTGAKRKSAK